MRAMLRDGRWTLVVAVLTVTSAFAQSFGISITNGADAGFINIASTVNQDFTTVTNGSHAGITCNTNADCVVEVSTTFGPNSYTEQQSAIFLTSFSYQTATATGDQIGRVKALVEQRSYNPSTGVYVWDATLRLDTNTSSTFTANYNFALYRGSTSSKNVITKGLTKTCTGVGGCAVAATQNVINVQPAGNNTFKGFMATGFDVRTTSGNKDYVGQLAVDVSVNAAGTTAGGYAGQFNRKQGMSCAFVVDPNDPEEVTCTAYTVAFATEGGHGGYVVDATTFANAASGANFVYSASAPTADYVRIQTEPVPLTGGETFHGLFAPLKKFDLTYTNTVPLTTSLGAGCASVLFNTTPSPDEGTIASFGLMRVAGPSGNPADDFEGRVECFANWAQTGP